MKLHLNLINKETEMNTSEQEAFTFLQYNNEDWANVFQQNLLAGRDKVTQRLVTSMQRENLVKAGDRSRIIDSTQVAELNIAQPYTLEIDFPTAQKVLYAPITGQHAFNRIDVAGPFYLVCKDNHDAYRVQHPNEILDCILVEQPELDNEASDQFRDDLINSATNMIFALSYQHFTMQQEREPLFNIIEQSDDSYLRSEQAVIEGHPLHPGAKLRKGMDARQTYQFSSEFAQPIELKVILIHQSMSRTQAVHHDYNQIVQDCFPELYEQLADSYADLSLDEYHVMLIHPWQFDEVLNRDYQEEIANHLMITTPYHVSYYAGLSFRTLAPKYPDMTPHIKLSTNVHITGEIRTLSEQTTHNGPLMTQILNDILNKDAMFNQYAATTIDELAGIHFYNSNDQGEHQTLRSEQLGTLFRRNFYEITPQEVISMIPSSLVCAYPFNDETPVVSLIKRFAEQQQSSSFEAAAKVWMQTYSNALLGLVVPLFTKYGIALEAHLQNAIANFNADGSLYKIYIRDFEGLRIDEAQLNTMGYVTDHFHEKSRILTDSQTSVFNKAFYSTVQNHLSELILTIAKASHSTTLENEIWQDVRHNLDTIFENIKDVDVERLTTIKETMFAPEIDYKCVTTMRLEDEAHHYTYIKVDNPLHKDNH